MKLTTGQAYDLNTLHLTRWTEGDGSGHEGYNVADYFRDGVYLGPDKHGIEPLFVESITSPEYQEALAELKRVAHRLPKD